MVRTDSGTTRPRTASRWRPPRSRRRREQVLLTGEPLTSVPFIDPRSTTTKPSRGGRISAWRREARGIGRASPCSRGAARCVAASSPSAMRRPSGSTSEPDVAAGPSTISATTSKSPGLEGVVGHEGDGDRADELVALVAGRAARAASASSRASASANEAKRSKSAGERYTPMLLGATGGRYAERAAVVEHAGDPVTDLDGLESAAEGLVEAALDQPLEPALEPLESHGGSVPAAYSDRAGTLRADGCRRRPTATLRAPSGEWRNWQTRRLQVPVSARTWGFKSPLAHREGAGTASVSATRSWCLLLNERRRRASVFASLDSSASRSRGGGGGGGREGRGEGGGGGGGGGGREEGRGGESWRENELRVGGRCYGELRTDGSKSPGGGGGEGGRRGGGGRGGEGGGGGGRGRRGSGMGGKGGGRRGGGGERGSQGRRGGEEGRLSANCPWGGGEGGGVGEVA